MRPLEILVPALLLIYLLWPRRRPLPVRLLPVLSVALVLVHLVLEGYRWQMVPLYILAPALAVVALASLRRAWDPRAAVALPILALVGVATALPALLPIPAIPDPDGPHRVGTRTFELIDTSRRELYSEKDEPRRFVVQVWYPAARGTAVGRVPWLRHAKTVAPAIASLLKLPSFFLDHLALAKIPATDDAGIDRTGGPLPLLLFSHGWEGFAAQNTGQFLQLASHGYVVAALQHPYGAVATVFADGSVAPYNDAILPEDVPNDPAWEVAGPVAADQWVGDLRFALDFMAARNAEAAGPFSAALDLGRVGVFGHSFGGGASIQFAAKEPRCRAVFAEDPFLRGVASDVLDGGLAQPSLFLFSEQYTADAASPNNALFARFRPHATGSLGTFFIRGTGHFDFSDLPRLSPLAHQLGLKGPIRAARMAAILDDYLASFFGATLQGIRSDLIDGARTYPEVVPR
jgi:predicted dienelactone hydrolase